jgi:hypothetical protein
MKFKTASITFAAALILICASALAEPFKVPPMSAKESGTMVVEYKEGGNRWTADWTTERYDQNGESFLRLTINGVGLTYPYSENMTWVTETVWKAGDTFYPVRSITTIKDMTGKLVRTDTNTLDLEEGKATFERQEASGNGSVSETFDFTPDTLIVDGIVMALRNLPFGTGEDFRAKFLTNEPELYNVEFKQLGIEKVKTPEGEIDCYKVELIPKLGVIGVLKVFFSKTYFWFTVAPPHRWVKYQGYENGRSSPEVVMKVVKFEQSSE